MIDAQKLRCLQALNVSVWHPTSKQADLPCYFKPARALVPGSILFVLNTCDLSKRDEVASLLQNIAFYLGLTPQQYSVAFVDEAGEEALTAEALLAGAQPKQILIFGEVAGLVLAEVSSQYLSSVDLCKALTAPLLKKQILQDLQNLRRAA